MRGVTSESLNIFELVGFLLTRLMRGVTEDIAAEIADINISTHTPHARRDQFG